MAIAHRRPDPPSGTPASPGAPHVDLEALGDWKDLSFVSLYPAGSGRVRCLWPPRGDTDTARAPYEQHIGVFCFGGDEVIRDEVQLARADSCLDRDEVADRLPLFLEQFGRTAENTGEAD
jgi:hypothetical protein